MEVITTEIDNFKTSLADFLKVKALQLNHLDIREVKDLVSIVSTLEASLAKGDTTQNVNVVIQNLVSKFDDDI